MVLLTHQKCVTGKDWIFCEVKIIIVRGCEEAAGEISCQASGLVSNSPPFYFPFAGLRHLCEGDQSGHTMAPGTCMIRVNMPWPLKHGPLELTPGSPKEVKEDYVQAGARDSLKIDTLAAMLP